jgi:hypothetical protein
VAPPERTACSGTASVLPPAPTVSSSRVRINREPAILTQYVFFFRFQVVMFVLTVNLPAQGCGWGDRPFNRVCFF